MKEGEHAEVIKSMCFLVMLFEGVNSVIGCALALCSNTCIKNSPDAKLVCDWCVFECLVFLLKGLKSGLSFLWQISSWAFSEKEGFDMPNIFLVHTVKKLIRDQAIQAGVKRHIFHHYWRWIHDRGYVTSTEFQSQNSKLSRTRPFLYQFIIQITLLQTATFHILFG